MASFSSARARRVTFTVRSSGSARAAAWFMLAFVSAGLVFVCLLPLAGRLALIHAADAYVPSTLTVQSVHTGRSTGRGRIFARGLLPDGRPATVALAGLAGPPVTSLQALEQRTGIRPARLDVMVNDELANGWMRRHAVRLPDPALKQNEMRDLLKLLGLMGGAAILAALGWRRAKALRC